MKCTIVAIAKKARKAGSKKDRTEESNKEWRVGGGGPWRTMRQRKKRGEIKYDQR
jgi:hypothetical protein